MLSLSRGCIRDVRDSHRQVVECVEQEDHRQHCITGRLVGVKRNVVCVNFGSGLLVNCGTGRPDTEADGHSGGGDQEQGSTSDSIAHQGAKDGGTVVVDVKDTVDQRLSFGVGDSDTDEHLGKVVGNQTVA